MTDPAVEAQALAREGDALFSQGKWAEAEALFLASLYKHPAAPAVWDRLGEARIRGRKLQDGIKACMKALEIAPDLLRPRRTLALGLLRQNRLAYAESLADEVLESMPLDPQALTILGAVRTRQGRLDEAFLLFSQAMALAPERAETHAELGNALKRAGHIHAAIACYRTARRYEPAFHEVLLNLGSALKDIGRFDEAAAAYRELAAADSDFREAGSNLLYCLNLDPSVDDETLAAAHREWGARHGQPLTEPPLAPHPNPPDPERTLRVGYVSADFGRHPVGYFLAPVLAAHDHRSIEVVCYSDRAVPDDMTEQLQASATRWHATSGLSDDALADLVRADGIDILVDLSGHTAGNRLPLFARRPAPVQISWLGYFHTTGLPAMDYILMDRHTVPETIERWFTETVAVLPQTRFCYAPPPYAPAVAAPPCERLGHVTFGSFNNLAKVSPAVIGVWARVLHAVPDSRLVLKWKTLVDPAIRKEITGAFRTAGIDPARLSLRPMSPHPDMLAEYADLDIALDPWPYCGGLTTCEALWMGVPVVTMPGKRPVSRQTLSFLNALGLERLAADSSDAYVALAASLAADRAQLGTLRRELRPRMAVSPLCNGPAFTRGLEAAFRNMWRHWCATHAEGA